MLRRIHVLYKKVTNKLKANSTPNGRGIVLEIQEVTSRAAYGKQVKERLSNR